MTPLDTSLAIAPPPPDTADTVGPSRLGRRRPARFPGAAPVAAGLVALWSGGSARLRALAADHVEAVGGILLDRVEASGLGDAPQLVLVDVSTLGRRPVRVATGRGTTLLALTDRAPDAEVWRACLELGARAVVQLPEESSRLLDLLGVAARGGGAGSVLGVVGGCGGAGASSTAARLAGAAVRSGRDAVLVDADPWGGGLDELVEAPATSRGARWEDLGRLGPDDGAALLDGLPEVDGVRLLTSRTDEAPSPERVGAALDALAPTGAVVLADLAASSVRTVLPLLDHLVLVVPGTEAAVRSAARRLRLWAAPPGRVVVLVRRIGPLAVRDVAEALEVEVAGSFRDGPAGLVPLLDVRRRGADVACRELLSLLAASDARFDR